MEARKSESNKKRPGFFSSFFEGMTSYFNSDNSLIQETENIHVKKISIDKPGKILKSPDDIMKGTAFFKDIYFIKISPDAEDTHAEEKAISDHESNEIESNDIIKIRLMDANKILTILDKDEESRSALEVINYFTSGNFISARADRNAQAHHNIFVKCLKRPEFYIQSILDALKETLNNENKATDLRNFLSTPLRDALVKGLFELKTIPSELDDAISAFASIGEDVTNLNFASGVKFVLLGSKLPNKALGVSSAFREVKELYLSRSKAFLANQKDAIFVAIQAFANDNNCQNLIALSIIQLIKEQYPVCKNNPDSLKSLLRGISIDDLDEYLNRSEIISIPASVTASENLVIILSCALSALYLNPQLKIELENELQEAGIDKLVSEETSEQKIKMLKSFFEQNENQNGLLHRIYLESCRRENLFMESDHLSLQTLQTRYTSKPILIEGHGTIPAKSTIMILPGTIRFNSLLWDNPKLFDPNHFSTNPSLSKYSLSIFSQGPRQCPAKGISSFLFKSIVSYLTLSCDLKLKISEDKRLSHIGVECVLSAPETSLKSRSSLK